MIWITRLRSLDLHSDNIITTTNTTYGKKLRPNFAVVTYDGKIWSQFLTVRSISSSVWLVVVSIVWLVTKLWRWSDMGSTTPQAQDWSPSALKFLGKPPTYTHHWPKETKFDTEAISTIYNPHPPGDWQLHIQLFMLTFWCLTKIVIMESIFLFSYTMALQLTGTV